MTTELGVNTTTAATYGNTAGRVMAASAYGPPARRPASAHGPPAVGEPAARRAGHLVSGPGWTQTDPRTPNVSPKGWGVTLSHLATPDRR